METEETLRTSWELEPEVMSVDGLWHFLTLPQLLGSLSKRLIIPAGAERPTLKYWCYLLHYSSGI